MSGVYKLITIGAIILCLISVSCSVFDGMESTEYLYLHPTFLFMLT